MEKGNERLREQEGGGGRREGGEREEIEGNLRQFLMFTRKYGAEKEGRVDTQTNECVSEGTEKEGNNCNTTGTGRN
jgi:hypothetical protein